MKLTSKLFAYGAASLLPLGAPSFGLAQELAADPVALVENRVPASVQVEGRPEAVYTLAERMAFYGVPGVSVAVLNDGRIEWARGWGMADVEAEHPVTEHTLFQAASISKPVAAAGALRLVEAGRLGLDDDVNQTLTTWKVPANELTGREAVTLRRLLSPTAGMTVQIPETSS